MNTDHTNAWSAICRLRQAARTLDLVSIGRVDHLSLEALAADMDAVADRMEKEIPQDDYFVLHQQTFPNDHENAYALEQRIYRPGDPIRLWVVKGVDNLRMKYYLEAEHGQAQADMGFEEVHRTFEPVPT